MLLNKALSIFLLLSLSIIPFNSYCMAESENAGSTASHRTGSLPVATDISAHKFMGTASCASSNCHGSAAPVKGSEVLQNEFVTWFRHDSHAKAYTVLLNDQSKRIAHNLSIKSAESEPLCLACHATYVPNEKDRGDKYRVADGVSCESCHGPASSWLKEHVATDTTHSNNVSLGLKDLSTSTAKSELCLSCHLGNEDKTVNHRLIGAGHPRLTFELDTFEAVMPRHWIPVKEVSGANAWLSNQVIQAAERSKALSSKSRSHSGIFPEFSNMHCYSCHHSLSEQQYQSREYDGRPGEANLNTSELWILSKALRVLDKGKASELESKSIRLRELFGKEDTSGLSKEISSYLTKQILPLVNSRSLSTQEQQKIFNELIEASHSNLQYETAEQIAMGAAAIAAVNPDSQEMKKAVKKLYAALDKPELFDPKLFKKARVRP